MFATMRKPARMAGQQAAEFFALNFIARIIHVCTRIFLLQQRVDTHASSTKVLLYAYVSRVFFMGKGAKFSLKGG